MGETALEFSELTFGKIPSGVILADETADSAAADILALEFSRSALVMWRLLLMPLP